MTEKRIAMISYHTCPLASEEGKETGGMNIYVLQTAQELSKLGFSIDIFTRSQDFDQDHIVDVAENLRVIHIKAGPESYLLPDSEKNKKNFFAYLAEFVSNIKLFQEKEQLTYDLIDAHYYLSGLAGLELKKFWQVPLVMSFHTLGLMKNLLSNTGFSEQDKERIESESKLIHESQSIISPSENEQKYLEYLYDTPTEKIKVISPGVDTSLFQPMDKIEAKKSIDAALDHKMILFVGRIDPVKGLDVLIYAMKIFIATNPDIKVCLWIVGGDVSQDSQLWSNELQKLEQLRKLLGLHTTVKFVGRKPQHDLPTYYNAADLVLMPSHYESFGMTALEAMACGTPVLTTNVTGVSELMDETCQKHITTANNPLHMAESMQQILAHDHKEEDEEIFAMVKEYDWKNVAEKLAKIMQKLILQFS